MKSKFVLTSQFKLAKEEPKNTTQINHAEGVYIINSARNCISSKRNALYIIKPRADTRWRVMRYNNGVAVVDDIRRTSSGDDMPSLRLG